MEDDFSDDDGLSPGETRQARRNKKKRSRKERREYKERLEQTALPWKKVKVEERVRFQEGGLFSLEELHYEGDVKDADFMHKLLAATPATHLSDSEKAGFKYYGDDEVPSDDEEAADGEEDGDVEEDQMDQVDEEVESNDDEDVVGDEDADDDDNQEEQEADGEVDAGDDAAAEEEEEEEEDGDDTVATKKEANGDGDGDDEEIGEKAKEWKASWDKLHPLLLRGLVTAGFAAPTPIQKAILVPSLVHRKDIIGAAETGSGKTLSFLLPIMHQILELREKYISKKYAEKEPQEIYGLILSPTRELALQIVEHAKTLAKFASIYIVPLVGGMAIQKQERFLSRKPHIIVATPGRLWEFMSSNHDVNLDLSQLRYLVLDEADKMVESGRFQELQSILQAVYSARGAVGDFDQAPDESAAVSKKKNEGAKPLQTFIFSATMTLSEDVRANLRRTKRLNKKGQAPKTMLDKLMENIEFHRKVEVIDLTSELIVASKLDEARIFCLPEEKDYYLYYFLEKYKGRTLIFVNAITNIKRIVPLLQMLRIQVWPMHAAMQQRQRLKNLDRFKANPNGVLVATDVMARGLDINQIDHVIHYQIPPTAELYVHRSGRTARAQASGLSLCIVDPLDKKNFMTIMQTLKREDMKEFPVDMGFYKGIKKRVETARNIDKVLHHQQKERSSQAWLKKAAADAGVDVEEIDTFQDDQYIKQKAVERQRLESTLKAYQAELRALLDRPVMAAGTSSKYITQLSNLGGALGLRAESASADLKKVKKRKAH